MTYDVVGIVDIVVKLVFDEPSLTRRVVVVGIVDIDIVGPLVATNEDVFALHSPPAKSHRLAWSSVNRVGQKHALPLSNSPAATVLLTVGALRHIDAIARLLR